MKCVVKRLIQHMYSIIAITDIAVHFNQYLIKICSCYRLTADIATSLQPLACFVLAHYE